MLGESLARFLLEDLKDLLEKGSAGTGSYLLMVVIACKTEEKVKVLGVAEKITG